MIGLLNHHLLTVTRARVAASCDAADRVAHHLVGHDGPRMRVYLLKASSVEPFAPRRALAHLNVHGVLRIRLTRGGTVARLSVETAHHGLVRRVLDGLQFAFVLKVTLRVL